MLVYEPENGESRRGPANVWNRRWFGATFGALRFMQQRPRVGLSDAAQDDGSP